MRREMREKRGMRGASLSSPSRKAALARVRLALALFQGHMRQVSRTTIAPPFLGRVDISARGCRSSKSRGAQTPPDTLDSRFRGNDGAKIGNYSAIIASLRPLRLRAFASNSLCQHALVSPRHRVKFRLTQFPKTLHQRRDFVRPVLAERSLLHRERQAGQG